MANKKFTDLTTASSVANTDILAVTVDPLGTPASRKVAVDVLMANAPVQSVAGQTGAVTLANTDISGLGTASTQDVGTANGNVVQLDATGLPAVDGSQLTNVSGTDSSKLAIANNLSDLNDAATARTNLGLGTAATTASTDYATSAQGSTADSAVQPTDSIDVLSDVDTSTVAPTDGQALIWDNSNSKWEPGPAGASSIDDLSDVDTSTTTPTTNDFLKWGGSNWVPAVPAADVDGPLTIALRGTDNPHIGSSPEQSFKVMDNPFKSAMVIADADGNITYLLKETSAEVRVARGDSGTPVRFALASDLPAFTLENDSGEPDIEVTEPTSGEKISVISGDSDTKGANGIPIRQGYNLPDIGANPPPLLISGGTIA